MLKTQTLINFIFFKDNFEDLLNSLKDPSQNKSDIDWKEIWKMLTLSGNQKLFTQENHSDLSEVVEKINEFYPLKQCDATLDLTKHAILAGKLDYAILLLENGGNYDSKLITDGLRQRYPQADWTTFLQSSKAILDKRAQHSNDILGEKIGSVPQQNYGFPAGLRHRHPHHHPHPPSPSSHTPMVF